MESTGGDPGATSMNGTATEADGSDGMTTDDPTDPPPPPEGSDAVDILFVVDNSGFMAAEQALLAAYLPKRASPAPLLETSPRVRWLLTYAHRLRDRPDPSPNHAVEQDSVLAYLERQPLPRAGPRRVVQRV